MARRLGRIVQAPFGVAYLLVVALAVRAGTQRRRRAGARPRLVYGPVPIISIKYMSHAMRSVGYQTATVVDDLYQINRPEDFDASMHTYGRTSAWRRILARILGPYAVLGWLLADHDVFHYFFDGGFLRRTPARFVEVQLVHLAGKLAIVMPYGSDVAIPSRIRSLDLRHGLMRNYPGLGRREGHIVRAMEYFTRHADYIVACLVHCETMLAWDLLTIHYYPIDTDEWSSTIPDSGNDGTDGPVTVTHAPNHRALKGTGAIIRACAELRAEGLDVQLRLLERVPNTEVLAAIDRSDIVAEQVLLGYGLTAMEGMSLSKPVMSNLEVEGYYEVLRRETRFNDCPIVSTTPERLRDDLRRLVRDPALRRRLGEAGRAYVMREHSYPAMAALWNEIYARVWHGQAVEPSDLLSPPLETSTAAATEPEAAEPVAVGARA